MIFMTFRAWIGTNAYHFLQHEFSSSRGKQLACGLDHEVTLRHLNSLTTSRRRPYPRGLTEDEELVDHRHLLVGLGVVGVEANGILRRSNNRRFRSSVSTSLDGDGDSANYC